MTFFVKIFYTGTKLSKEAVFKLPLVFLELVEDLKSFAIMKLTFLTRLDISKKKKSHLVQERTSNLLSYQLVMTDSLLY